MNIEKYSGVIPAFYACYDPQGEVSPEGTRALIVQHASSREEAVDKAARLRELCRMDDLGL